MKEDLMDIICCPLDKQELELDVDEREDRATSETSQADGEAVNGEILAGTLTCTECGETYPIEDGIPNLLPPDMREEASA